MTEGTPDPMAEAMAMRASDADRERVAGLLRDAYAEGRLSLNEHEERLSTAYAATTYADLVPVLHDLPVPRGTLTVPESRGLDLVAAASNPAPGSVVVRPELADQGERQAVAVFGGFERKGAWVVRSTMSATCVFGGGELDFSQAVFTSRETTLTAFCMFGGLDITVPAGMAVRNEAFAIFGGHSMPKDSAPEGAPVLIIKGAAIFGGVDVHRPKSPKPPKITKG